jgi:hypothetical protein
LPSGSITRCFACQADLREGHLQEADSELVDFQSYLYQILKQGYTDNLQYSHLFFDGLHHVLKLLVSKQRKAVLLQEAISREMGIKSTLIHGTYKLDFDYQDHQTRVQLISMAQWLLREWPMRFIDLCKRHKIWSSYLLKDLTDVPYWYWREVKEHLYFMYTPWRNLDVKKSWHSSYQKMAANATKCKISY